MSSGERMYTSSEIEQLVGMNFGIQFVDHQRVEEPAEIPPRRPNNIPQRRNFRQQRSIIVDGKRYVACDANFVLRAADPHASGIMRERPRRKE